VHHVADQEVEVEQQEKDRSQMDDHKYAEIQAELATAPPAEPSVARQNKNIGSTARPKQNL
jgi:hypothetical protein